MSESRKAKTSAAKIAAQMRYNSKKIDNINVSVSKGRKEEYKQAAKLRGVGLMELFRRGADEYIANHPPITQDSEENKNNLDNPTS